ncbi:MAG: LysM peptidoglycan-binding domain-containing protein [Bacteroidales bacterium]|nr:LysM peptidoglycan-binding domain-containing protein [Bacteroidales bacterium]
MRNRLILIFVVLVLSMRLSYGQAYVPTPVTISKETVKVDGKLYYSHVVLERQTLYSISKTYQVSIDEIYDANEAIQLRETGLKKNSIIRIPVNSKNKSIKGKTIPGELEPEAEEDNNAQQQQASQEQESDKQEENVPEVEVKDSIIVFSTEQSQEESVQEPEPIVREAAVALMLPFDLRSGKADPNYLDFYSGVLIATAELADAGIDINLDVFDCKDQKVLKDSTKLNRYDVILGPVSREDLQVVLDNVHEDTFVVSPMDPRPENLTATHRNLIQMYVPKGEQLKDITAQVKKKKYSDRVIIVSEAGVSTNVDNLKSLLAEAGISYEAISLDIAHAKTAYSYFTPKMVKKNVGENYVIMMSEREMFVNEILRNCSRMNSLGYNVKTLTTSKLKSMDLSDVKMVHDAQTYVSTANNVDYSSDKVRRFILKYRALCHTEPSSFAYQGYDLMKYFGSIVAQHGKDWPEFMGEHKSKMLQITLDIQKVAEDGGYINKGMRRVCYDKNLNVESFE